MELKKVLSELDLEEPDEQMLQVRLREARKWDRNLKSNLALRLIYWKLMMMWFPFTRQENDTIDSAALEMIKKYKVDQTSLVDSKGKLADKTGHDLLKTLVKLKLSKTPGHTENLLSALADASIQCGIKTAFPLQSFN